MAHAFQIYIQAGRESKMGRNATEMLVSAWSSDIDFGEFGEGSFCPMLGYAPSRAA